MIVIYKEGEFKCSSCGIPLGGRGIHIIGMGYNPDALLCAPCAQHLMRILLEDLIKFWNPDGGVSLLNIMYGGGGSHPGSPAHPLFTPKRKKRKK